jgi:hypothetical protein
VLCQLFVGAGAGDPEIDEVGEVIRTDQNVLRLYVPMQHPAACAASSAEPIWRTIATALGLNTQNAS